MRERKFRVWTGSKMEYNVMVGALGAFYVEGIDPKDSACLSPFNTKYSEETPVMEYTGLSDKNGKEIYEGDAVKTSNDTRMIEWKNGAFWVQSIAHKWNYPLHFHDKGVSDFEVIGDIYSTPQLIGG